MMNGVEEDEEIVQSLPPLLRRGIPPEMRDDESITATSNQSQPSKSSGPKVPRRAYVAVSILFFVNLLNYMDRFTIAGVLTDIQSYYNIDDTLAGLLQTVFICAYMLFAPIFGYLGDRYSRKWLMSGGIFLWSLSVLASSFVPSDHEWAFFLCRAAVGIGEASYSTVAPTIIADLFPAGGSRSRMLMLFYFAIPVGSGLGFVVGSNVAHLAKSWGAEPERAWEWGVRVTPIIGVAALLLIILVLQEPKRGECEDCVSGEPSSYFDDLRSLTKNPTYLWCTAGFTCVAFVAGCVSWWTPNFVIYSQETIQSNVDKQHINLVFGVITCASGFLGVGLGSTLSSRWRQTNLRADPLVCSIGLFLSCPFLFAALNVVHASLTGAWVMTFIAITCVSLNWSIVSDILLYTVIPSRRATAAALQILVSHLLGDAFSPLLLGKVSDEICGDNCSVANHFLSLKYALFIPAFVLVFGGYFFLLASNYIEGDRVKAQREAAGVVSVTQASASLIHNADSNSALIT